MPDSITMGTGATHLLFLVTEDWYFVSHRLHLARAALREGYRVTVMTRVREHGHTIRQAGCELIPLEWRRRGGGITGELRVLRRITSLYRELAPDIVHHVALKPIVIGSMAARAAGVPNVINAFAGLGYLFSSDSSRARVLRPVALTALRLAMGGRRTRGVLQNRDDLDLLQRAGVAAASKFTVIRGSGVSLTEFQPVVAARDGVVVTLAARMLRHKGIPEFVAAAQALRGRGIEARFLLVGDSDPDNPAAVARDQLRAWHAEGCIEWLGHRTDMPAIWALTDIACLPTSYREGVPKVLLEAAAAGLPIVATDAAGCREIVRSGINGLLVPPRDVAALTDALHKLITDPALRRSMGEQSRLLVEQEFGEERVVAETLALYHDLLAAPLQPSVSR